MLFLARNQIHLNYNANYAPEVRKELFSARQSFIFFEPFVQKGIIRITEFDKYTPVHPDTPREGPIRPIPLKVQVLV